MVNKTVVITGTSTGIGRATVELFSSKGWRIGATMRSPENEHLLNHLPGVTLFQLDITDHEQVKACSKRILAEFGQVDVLVNNAGYALLGPMETATQEQIHRQFETNVFGPIALIDEFLPAFRKQGSGAIINVSSIGGRIAFPLYSIYHGTKWALEGISESLYAEMKPFGIKVRLIEPGSIRTDFNSRSQDVTDLENFPEYRAYTETVSRNILEASSGKLTGSAAEVALTIFKAATDKGARLRYPTAGNAGLLMILRRLLGDRPIIAFGKLLLERDGRKLLSDRKFVQ